MSRNVLIVDDSATTRAMVRRIIGLCGAPTGDIYEAPDGRDALDLLGRHPVDLVLADLHMPRMGGIEMAERMRGDPALKGIPVVIISADPNVGRGEQFGRLGVRGHLTKPFTPEGFRSVLGDILGAQNDDRH